MRRLWWTLAFAVSCTCGPISPGSACASDDECSGGQVCLNGKCAPACSPDRPCPTGRVCRDGLCVPDNECGGVACMPDETCIDDMCWPNACNGIECPPGFICKNGECIDALCLGVVCPAGQICYRGVCIGGTCAAGAGGGAGGGSAGGGAGGGGGSGGGVAGGGAGGGTAGGATGGGATGGGATGGGATGGGATGGGATGGGTGGGATGGGTGGGVAAVTGNIEGVVVHWNRCDLQPIPAAVVSTPGAASVVTDLNGRFRLTQVPIGSNVVVTVRVSPSTIFTPVTHALVDVRQNTTSHVMVRLFSMCTETTVLVPSTSVMFVGNTACQTTGLVAGVTHGDLLWADGGVYDGTLTMSYASLQHEPIGDGGFDLAGLAALPGRGTGLDSTDAGVNLETLGAAWVEFIDNVSSERLQLAAGHSVPIEIPSAIDPSLPPQPTGWWFDGALGQWREHGAAPSIDDAGTAFAHSIDRFGWWAAQRPLAAVTCAEGVVTDGTNNIAGADVRLIGNDFGWFGKATTDNAGRFCVATPPNIKVAGIARQGDLTVGAALDPYAVRLVQIGNAGPQSCNVGVVGCLQLGTVPLVSPQRSCVTGSIHDSPLPDGGLPPLTDDVYVTADVAIQNDYRRTLCQSQRVRLSGVVSGLDGGFCVAGTTGAFRLGNDQSPYTCRPSNDPIWDAGAGGGTCGGAGCNDVGSMYWYCQS